MKADFRRMSDGLGPTVTLMKIKDNDQCVGGFTSAQFASPQDDTFFTDTTAMLFNLTTQQLFKCQYHKWAIKCNKDKGPCFGNGELLALLEPFNKDNACQSKANKDGYQIGMDKENINKLTTLKLVREYGYDTCLFSINELEVWEIIFSE